MKIKFKANNFSMYNSTRVKLLLNPVVQSLVVQLLFNQSWLVQCSVCFTASGTSMPSPSHSRPRASSPLTTSTWSVGETPAQLPMMRTRRLKSLPHMENCSSVCVYVCVYIYDIVYIYIVFV